MLVGQHYQNGYICDNLEEGIARFRARGLDKEPTIIPVEQEVLTPHGPKRQKMRITMFWLNGLQYELIEPTLDETDLYAHAPANGGPVRFHHICLKVDNWDDFRAQVDKQDFPIVCERGGDELKFLYLDARKDFGHFLEYTWMTDARWEQIQAL